MKASIETSSMPSPLNFQRAQDEGSLSVEVRIHRAWPGTGKRAQQSDVGVALTLSQDLLSRQTDQQATAHELPYLQPPQMLTLLCLSALKAPGVAASQGGAVRSLWMIETVAMRSTGVQTDCVCF